MLRYHNWGKQLVKSNHEVCIVAGSSVHNTDIDVIEETHRTTSIVDGVKYYYIKTPKYKGNRIGRIICDLEYCKQLKQISKIMSDVDVVISSMAYKFPFVKKYFKTLPIIVDITDLWPISVIQYANKSKYNPLIQYLYYLEKKAYIEADALVFSIEGGPEYVHERKYAPKINFDKVFCINMGCDIEQKDKELQDIEFDLGWGASKFNLVYCGSIRQANQVQQICDAAKELLSRRNDDIAFHIYGNGTDLEKLKKYVEDNNITNVRFYGRIEKKKIPFILSHSDVNILTYKQVPLMKYGGSQSKLFDYLASGKPIICNCNFGYNLITRYDCGIVTKDQTANEFANAVEEIYRMNNETRQQMGLNARKVAEMYDQPIIADQVIKVIDYVLSQSVK